jgi:hypothetical protein
VVGLFRAFAQTCGPPPQIQIDSSAVKAHRSAAGRTTKIFALTDAQSHRSPSY